MQKEIEGRSEEKYRLSHRVGADLGPGTLDQLDAMVDLLQRGRQRKVTRSEVIRRAILHLYVSLVEDGEKGGGA